MNMLPVPDTLMSPSVGVDPGVIAGVMGPYLHGAGLSPDKAFEFVAGAVEHQMMVSDESSKVIPAVIERVERSERRGKGSNYLVGVKYTIHFMARNADQSDSIDTGWVEYNGRDSREHAAWQVAHSNRVLEKAQENIGNEVYIRKAFREVEGLSKGSRVRFAADIHVAGGGSKSSSQGAQRPAQAQPQEPQQAPAPEPSPAQEPQHQPQAQLQAPPRVLSKDDVDMLDAMLQEDDADELEEVADVVCDTLKLPPATYLNRLIEGAKKVQGGDIDRSKFLQGVNGFVLANRDAN